jgi:ubiquinone/menaquinone biosynthesis C-methylase UbiE
MSREPEIGFVPEEVVNIETFSTDAEREKYFRFGLTTPEAAVIRRYFVETNARLLDIGCGYGRTSRPLAEMGFRVTAIDIVPRMIVEARKAAPGVRFCLMSATDLGFDDETFDYAFFSFNGIDLIVPEARRAQTLREIWRVLRPGGCVIYSAHNWLAFVATSFRHSSRARELTRNFARRGALPGYFRVRQSGGDLVLHLGVPWAEMSRLRAAGFRSVAMQPGKLSPRLQRLGVLARAVLDRFPYYVGTK